jgi:hypothetical protein
MVFISRTRVTIAAAGSCWATYKLVHSLLTSIRGLDKWPACGGAVGSRLYLNRTELKVCLSNTDLRLVRAIQLVRASPKKQGSHFDRAAAAKPRRGQQRLRSLPTWVPFVW